MPSWRDSVPDGVQADLDGLLDTALWAAQRMLDEHGEFFGFGASIDASGTIALAAGYDGPGGQSPLDVLVQGFRSRRDELRGVAFVDDVLADGADAIRVLVEHREGQAIYVLSPYAKRHSSAGFEYGELSVGAWQHPKVWNA